MAEARRRYRLYIDESGDPVRHQNESPGTKYLGLLGLWVRRPDCYAEMCERLSALKADIFGNPAIVLHRSTIINYRSCFGRLKEPDTQRRFNAALLRLVSECRFTIYCAIVDKTSHADTYSAPKHPYHYCAEALAERYAGWLRRYGGCGDASAESRGRREDSALARAWNYIYENGTDFQPKELFRSRLLDGTLVFKTKQDDVPGLQLADILAHPIKAYCLHHAGLCERPTGFGSELASAAHARFNRRHADGRIEGYGYSVLSSF